MYEVVVGLLLEGVELFVWWSLHSINRVLDACYGKGSSFWLTRFLNDRAP